MRQYFSMRKKTPQNFCNYVEPTCPQDPGSLYHNLCAYDKSDCGCQKISRIILKLNHEIFGSSGLYWEPYTSSNKAKAISAELLE